MKLDVSKVIDLSSSEIEDLLYSRPSLHYKVYKIPKRSHGFRTIAQPTPQVKNIQRLIVRKLSKKIKPHSAAKAYIKKQSIVTNATAHINSNYLLKLDFKDFFNSITPNLMFKAFEREGFEVTELDKAILSEVLFWNRSRRINGKLILSVGAPSSPFISNFIMKNFDSRLNDICKRKRVTYTRYADDMVFSTKEKNVLPKLLPDIKALVSREFEGSLKINHSKTVFSSKAHNRHITGITLTNDNRLSLGRERKRLISCLVHKYSTGMLDEIDTNYLAGLLGLAKNIEPNFVYKLVKKYGSHIVRDILTKIKEY